MDNCNGFYVRFGAVSISSWSDFTKVSSWAKAQSNLVKPIVSRQINDIICLDFPDPASQTSSKIGYERGKSLILKKWVIGITSGLLVSGGICAPALAATSSGLSRSSITINNDSVATPTVVQKNGVDYIPLWYVIRALSAIGIHGQWTGSDWYLSTSLPVPHPVMNPASQQGSVSVYLNGSKIGSFSALVAIDPSSKHPTTYLRVTDLSTILQHVNVLSTWQGNSYQLETPAVKTLSEAFQNMQNATNSQLTGDLTEHIQVNLNPQAQDGTGATPGTSRSSGSIPTSLDLQMKLSGETGVVNGEKASLVTITPVATSGSSTSTPGLPTSIQEYVQGTRIWINTGTGWTEATSSEQVLQSLQSEMPVNSVNFGMLRNIQAAEKGDITTYSATLNMSAIEKILAPIMSSVVSSSAASNALSSSQLTSLLQTIIKEMQGTLHLTAQPVNGVERITSEQVTIDLTLPGRFLPQPQGSTAPANAVQSIRVHEVVTANFTYNPVTVVPPLGITTSSSPAPSSTTPSSTAASAP